MSAAEAARLRGHSWQAGPNFFVHCYTFDYSEHQVRKRLEHLVGFMPNATKIRRVRLVAPSKIMYCVEFNFSLQDGEEKTR